MSSSHQTAPSVTSAASREAFVEQQFHAGRDRDIATAGDRVAATAGDRDAATAGATPADAAAVVGFWRQAGPSMWFAKDDGFDRRFREAFLGAHQAATRGDLDNWQATSDGALALLLLLDQFPRNAFRGTPLMYASDATARRIAAAAIAAGHDRLVAPDLRKFFYLPFAHSEDIADQERSAALCNPLGPPDSVHAERHRDIVRRFGRFPHRNTILGRNNDAGRTKFSGSGRLCRIGHDPAKAETISERVTNPI